MAKRSTRSDHRARLARGSYRSAEDLEGRPTAPDGGGDYHADTRSRADMRRLSRSADRNASLYRGPLSAFLGFLLGDGSWPRPYVAGPDGETLSKSWSQDAQTTRFDAAGESTLDEMLTLWGRSVLRDGDVGGVHDGRGAVAICEADRLLDPPATRGVTGLTGGIQRDRLGRHQAYWIADYDSLGRLNASHARSYPASRVTFTAHRDRKSQVRGTPVMGAGLDDIDRLDSLNDAEIKTAEAAALPLAFLEQTTAGGATGSAPGLVKTEAAALVTLPRGLKATTLPQSRPNLDVIQFTRSQLRVISMLLGVPLELLMLDLGELNYAASRSLRNLAEDALGKWRRLLFHPLLNRLWAEWCADRGVEAPAVEWQWPRLQVHDRIKESLADEQELANGTTSLARLTGHNRLTILTELAEEDRARDTLMIERIAEAQRQIIALNADIPGLNLHWSAVIAAPGAKSAPGAYMQGVSGGGADGQVTTTTAAGIRNGKTPAAGPTTGSVVDDDTQDGVKTA